MEPISRTRTQASRATLAQVPRVSVIIPAHDAEAHIGEALRSVQRQTYDDWEVVVGDDASGDRTGDVVEGFGPRFSVVRSEQNLGPANGRNIAIARSSGELVALLDADDSWLPDYLGEQVRRYDEEVAAGRRVGVVSPDARLLDPDGSFRDETYVQIFGSPGGVSLTDLLERNPIFVGSLMPRSAIDQAGGFSTDTWGSEDHDMFIRIVELGYEVVANPKPLYVYRQSEGSVSRNLAGMARTNQATYRRALERGRLDRRQRRIARRQLRLYRAVEEVARIGAARRRGAGAALASATRALPLFVSVAVRDPGRIRSWVRETRSATRA